MIVLASFPRYGHSMVAMVVMIFVVLQQTCSAKHHPPCSPSSCGKIHNISHPFRLKGDPRGCGLPRYELDCVNNLTVFTLFSGKYHVQEINYKNYTIRLTDAGVVENPACPFPRYFLNTRNFTYQPPPDYTTTAALTILSDNGRYRFDEYLSVGLLKCTNPVTDDPRYVKLNTSRCNDSKGHIYALVEYDIDYQPLGLKDIKVGCHLKVVTLAANFFTKTGEDEYVVAVDTWNASYADIHKWLNHGFWLSWLQPVICREKCGKHSECSLNHTTAQVQCDQLCHDFGSIGTTCVF